jgi:hypothetical protein
VSGGGELQRLPDRDQRRLGPRRLPRRLPGSYLLRASQDGWADTVVGPLGFGADASPKAPREVLVILNPVCFDC